jgi:DNA gyrase/topoisomerase IV subunit A
MNITTEKLYNAVMELKPDIESIKTDIKWIKDEIKEIKEYQINCRSCTNSTYIIEQTNKNRNDIDNLKKKENITIGICIACSGIISIIITLTTVYIKLRNYT